MSKTLNVTLKKGLIIDAVKTDTFISGQTEKLGDGSNNAKVYNETAGDDTIHERKLDRTLRGAVGALESFMVDFIDPAGTVSVDGLTEKLSIYDDLSKSTEDKGGVFHIYFAVSDRFNSGLSSAIAQLMQEYLINKMVCLWWAAVVDRKNDVSQYNALAQESLVSIRKCLQKTAPTPSSALYSDVEGKVVSPKSDGSSLDDANKDNQSTGTVIQ